MDIKIEKTDDGYAFLVAKADFQAVLDHLEGKGFSVSGLPPELSDFGHVHFNNAHPEKIAVAMQDFVSGRK